MRANLRSESAVEIRRAFGAKVHSETGIRRKIRDLPRIKPRLVQVSRGQASMPGRNSLRCRHFLAAIGRKPSRRGNSAGWGAWIRTRDGGTKNRCLTAWRRPNMRKPPEIGGTLGKVGRGRNPEKPPTRGGFHHVRSLQLDAAANAVGTIHHCGTAAASAAAAARLAFRLRTGRNMWVRCPTCARSGSPSSVRAVPASDRSPASTRGPARRDRSCTARGMTPSSRRVRKPCGQVAALAPMSGRQALL